jgi:hypothetical protein
MVLGCTAPLVDFDLVARLRPTAVLRQSIVE